MASYYDIAHSFFYADEGIGRGSGSYSSRLWYSKPWACEKGIIMNAYSYSTIIAQIRLDKQGRKVCVMSNYRYSNTTAKHLSYLRQACPFDILYVPHVESNPLTAFEDNLKRYVKMDFDENEFRHKEEREYLLDLLRMFDEYDKRIGTSKRLRAMRRSKAITNKEELCRAINADRANVANISEAAKKRHQRMLAKQKAERERVKKFVDKFMHSKNQNETLQAAFRYDYWRDDKLKALHEALTKGNGYAFVWFDADANKVCTSKRVSVSVDEVQRLLMLWHARSNIIGQKCSMYTIVENNSNHVKIGCHTIPVWNVQMLYNTLIR